MGDIQFQTDLSETTKYLKGLIQNNTEGKALVWLDKKLEQLQTKYEEKQLFMQFSMASRYFTKTQQVSVEQLAEANQLRKGFDPSRWDTLQIARTLLLLTIPYKEAEQQLSTLNKLFESADVSELVALYSALPLLPNPKIHIKRAAEGIRTNMTIVLDAVALNNPFPTDYFDEISWNQLVLKTIFTERPVYQIYNADSRANERLAATLSDYAHERWAAGRAVTPELWRFTDKFVSANLLSDFKHLLEKGTDLEKNAAFLACKDADTPQTLALIKNKEFVLKLDNWDELGKAYHQEKGPLPTGYQQAGSGVSKPD